MEMNLRSALIISVIIHAGIFAPFYNQHLLRMEIEKKNSVVVDYVVLKEIVRAITKNKEVALKTPETPRIDIKKEVDVKPQPQMRKMPEDTKKAEVSKAREAEKARSEDAAKKAAAESAKKESDAKQKKDYISYYQLIREKIRARLKNNYAYYNREGDVLLSFTIARNGALLDYNIDRSKSTRDEVLLHITAASIKAVSPFPPIPKSLSAPKMSFSLIVSFRK